LVWTCTENGKKYNSQKNTKYEFGINKAKRQTKKQMERLSEGGWKNSWCRRVVGKSITERNGRSS
jgi:hypothetical protein